MLLKQPLDNSVTLYTKHVITVEVIIKLVIKICIKIKNAANIRGCGIILNKQKLNIYYNHFAVKYLNT